MPTKQGMYIEFRSALNSDLITKSLEDQRAGIRLLNVRKEIESENVVTCATVYVPNGKETKFIEKFRQYQTECTQKGNPKHDELARSIEDIRLAVLEAFWTDDKSKIPSDTPIWCEFWLCIDKGSLDNLELFETIESNFIEVSNQNQVPLRTGALRFPERSVMLGYANRTQLKELIEECPYISEIRKASETAQFFLGLTPAEQTEWVKELLSRTTYAANSEVAVCVLDSGVNNSHPLIGPILNDKDCMSYDSTWGVNDTREHGTLMAGLCGYGDIQALLEIPDEIIINHILESVKILPPTGDNEAKHDGYITIQSVSRAEIENSQYNRIICMAVTREPSPRGIPSSWSGAIDMLSSGSFDNKKRLFIVSAGNVPCDNWANYPDTNITYPVEDPGQSWNALTIGAFTQKTTISDPSLKGYDPIAPLGALSPFSSTSLNWDRRKWPIKPDVVFEGGNVAKDGSGFCTECDDLSLLTTYDKYINRLFTSMNGTSAASALAANFAAKLQSEYPNAWPETIRALIVHSAEWTDSMKSLFISGKGLKTQYQSLIRCCGYGVPSLDRAMWCANNSVNLIVQTELQPYEKKGSDYRTKDMHLHDLPWPKDVLLALGEVSVKMRVTLSYFVEPAPGEIGWQDRYRYPSCVLRFDIKRSSETREDFMKRINVAAQDDGDTTSDFSGVSNNWIIGSQGRDLGSIHSDIWEGTAADLSECNTIGIYPKIGWWKLRPNLKSYNKKIRYSLIISLSTPKQDVDLYTPIITQIKVPVPIEITSL